MGRAGQRGALGLCASLFRRTQHKTSEALGARYSPEERAGFHAVWRYAGYLMGIPETILFTDESHALHIYRTGSICEPPPTTEAIIMTNALINSAPLVAGIEDKEEREKLVKGGIYPISRALIGNDLADQLNFPRNRFLFGLFWFRLDQRIQRLKARLRKEGPKNFSALLAASAYDDAGLSYRLPDHAQAERSGNW